MNKSTIVNIKDINALISKDKTFKTIHDQYGSPPNWTRPQGFISLSKLIIEQQVSLASAESHFNKLNCYISEFTPDNILKLSDEEMLSCYISRQKASYLRALSKAVIHNEINLEKLSEQDEAEVRKQLTQIKGIGNWTTDIYLIECLQYKDIFPLGDIAVINIVKEVYGEKTKDEIQLMAENWKPYRSLAAYFFWHYYLEKKKRKSL